MSVILLEIGSLQMSKLRGGHEGGPSSDMTDVLLKRRGLNTGADASRGKSLERHREGCVQATGCQRLLEAQGEAWGRASFTAGRGDQPCLTRSQPYGLQNSGMIELCHISSWLVVLCYSSPWQLIQHGWLVAEDDWRD